MFYYIYFFDLKEERQENEVEALKAIYEGDFEDLRQRDVWKVID